MTQGMVASGTLTPEVYKKVKRPFEDTLYVLGVKDCNTYLPNDEEVLAMISAGKAAAKARQPTPVEQKDTSMAELNKARTQEVLSSISGDNADHQLEFMSMASGTPKVYNG